MEHPPKPNTQAISWFFGESQKHTLILDPKYQRNPIWSLGQQCFLIDSLISGTPIPQIFLNITADGQGTKRKTLYEVVDGQQRLRAILGFLRDEYPLVKTTVKSYPVSEQYVPHIGKRYSELPEKLQEQIWNYPVAVQELRGWGEQQIRALFRRLNSVNERLNKQELRHSQYFGEFTEAVEKLAERAVWDDLCIFSRRDGARMKDVEYVSELFAVVIDGIQDQQSTLDKFYADYDVSFPKRKQYEKTFDDAVTAIQSIAQFVAESRFSKKADFYALFAASIRINAQLDKKADLSGAVPSLKKLAKELDKEPSEMKGWAAEYHSSVIEGPNKKPKRMRRTDILLKILTPKAK